MPRLSLFALFICLIVITGCGGPQAAPTSSQPAAQQAPAAKPTAQQPAAPASAQSATQVPASQAPAAKPVEAKQGGTITEGVFADAQTLNSVLSRDTASSAVLQLLGNGLVWLDPQTLLPMPQLAQEWAVSPDSLTYTFKLRDDVKFHDGQKLTADDVKFTYDLILNEKVNSPRRANLAPVIDSISVKSPTEIEFKLKSVKADLLVTDMSYQILPKHLLGGVKPEDMATSDFNTKTPVYSGPFKFKEWVKADHITLVANPDYFLGRPKVDQYIFKVVQDANVVAAQLKTGEIDFGAFEPAFLAEMEKQPHLTVHAFDQFSFTFYSYQLDPAKTTVFQDQKLRQALAYALDREAMVKVIMFGQGQVAHSTQPVLSWAYNKDNQPRYSYDTKKAEALLDEAGWKKGADGVRAKDGQKLSFTCYTNAGNKVRESYLTVMQEQWRKVGVEMTPKTEEWNAFLDRITKTKDFDCFLVGFSWGVDPNQKTMFHTSGYEGGFNMGKYSNAQVDKLLDDALTTTDVAKRKDLYFQAQKIIAEEMPVVILDFPKGLAATNKRVQNMVPNAVNWRHQAYLWSVTDGK